MRINTQVVDKYGVQSGIHCAGDIRIQVISYHDAFSVCSIAFSHCKLKYFPVWLQAVAVFGGNDLYKEVPQVAAR